MSPITIIHKCKDNEDGFVLVGALLILLLLVIIGVSATTNTSLELQIAGNERIYKETFYQADGGTQLAARLIEESLGSSAGFTALDANNVLTDPTNQNNTILIQDTTIGTNIAGRNQTNVSDAVIAGVPQRDFAFFPNGYNPALVNPNVDPHTNVIADGVTGPLPGSGMNAISGSLGAGGGAAGLGTQILFTIYSQHIGRSNSESVVKIEYRHVNGLELTGRY